MIQHLLAANAKALRQSGHYVLADITDNFLVKPSDKWDRRFMSLIQNEVSTWSKDPSTQVAALIVSPDRRTLITGYNGFPQGIEDVHLDNKRHKYKRIIHAELNAILNAQRDLHGFTLYVTPLSPCNACACAIIQSGISRVVTDYEFGTNPRWDDSMQDGINLFTEAGVDYVTIKS